MYLSACYAFRLLKQLNILLSKHEWISITIHRVGRACFDWVMFRVKTEESAPQQQATDTAEFGLHSKFVFWHGETRNYSSFGICKPLYSHCANDFLTLPSLCITIVGYDVWFAYEQKIWNEWICDYIKTVHIIRYEFGIRVGRRLARKYIGKCRIKHKHLFFWHTARKRKRHTSPAHRHRWLWRIFIFLFSVSASSSS